MKPALSTVVNIRPRMTQRRLRMTAFARKFCETMDSALSYREVFRPAQNPKDDDKFKGDALLKIRFVQQRIGEVIEPAIRSLGIDQTFVIRRLLETIDGDITDYVKVVPSADGRDAVDLMSLQEMRDALPLAKRRLVKKYKVTYNEFGGVKSREIELESKQPAMELLAKIRGWVSGANTLVIDGKEMIRKMEEARKMSLDRATAMRAEITQSNTFAQLQTPAKVRALLEGPKNETKNDEDRKP